jgi:hypothetical protein
MPPMLTAGLVIAGWISVYLLLRRMLQRSIEQLDSHLRDQLQALRNQVQQTSVAIQNEPAFDAGSQGDHALSDKRESEGLDQGDGEFAGMGPEKISVLRTTLSAFVGQEVRIRSVKKLPASNGLSNAWAREGCVLVQNSHAVELSKTRPARVRDSRVGPSRNEVRRRAT